MASWSPVSPSLFASTLGLPTPSVYVIFGVLVGTAEGLRPTALALVGAPVATLAATLVGVGVGIGVGAVVALAGVGVGAVVALVRAAALTEATLAAALVGVGAVAALVGVGVGAVAALVGVGIGAVATLAGVGVGAEAALTEATLAAVLTRARLFRAPSPLAVATFLALQALVAPLLWVGAASRVTPVVVGRVTPLLGPAEVVVVGRVALGAVPLVVVVAVAVPVPVRLALSPSPRLFLVAGLLPRPALWPVVDLITLPATAPVADVSSPTLVETPAVGRLGVRLLSPFLVAALLATSVAVRPPTAFRVPLGAAVDMGVGLALVRPASPVGGLGVVDVVVSPVVPVVVLVVARLVVGRFPSRPTVT